jgi:hypothetical protein
VLPTLAVRLRHRVEQRVDAAGRHKRRFLTVLLHQDVGGAVDVEVGGPSPMSIAHAVAFDPAATARLVSPHIVQITTAPRPSNFDNAVLL